MGALGVATGALLWWPRGRRRLAAWPLPADGAERPARVLLLAVGFALLIAVSELAVRRVRLSLGPWLSENGPYAWWSVPLADVLFFLPLAAGLAAAAAAGWPRLGSLRAVVFAFGFLAAVGTLFLFQLQLHLAAIPILAAGLAATLARFAADRPARFHALAKRAVPALALLVALGAVAGVAGEWAVARRERAALPAAPREAPNVLLIVLDTVRAANLSLHGYRRETTPTLERFARRGIVFDQAYAPAPWTLPTHASVFTGRYPHELSADVSQPLDGTYPTLAERLGALGYVSGGFAANYYYTGPHSGLARGFLRYPGVRTGLGGIVMSSALGRMSRRSVTISNLWGEPGRKDATTVTDEFLDWVDGVEDRPYFVFLNYFDAHEPYGAPPPYDRRFPDPPPPGPQRGENIRAELDGYDGAIAYIDHELSRLLAALERRGDLDATIVVVTSDHGEAFGEHGLRGHGSNLYRPSLHVPLLIVYPPRVPAGRRVAQLVTLRDVPATILALAGHGKTLLPGRSLAWTWSREGVSPVGQPPGDAAPPVHAELRGRPWEDERFPVSKGDMTSLITEEYHFIVNGDGREELYDYQRDPWEQTDLAATAEGVRRRPGLRAALARQEAGS